VGRSAAAQGASSGNLRTGCGGDCRGPFHLTYLRAEHSLIESGGDDRRGLCPPEAPPLTGILQMRRARQSDLGSRPSRLHRFSLAPAPFEGDLAIKDLRDRLSADPDFVPCPPIPQRSKRLTPLVARFGLVGALVALGYAATSVRTSELRPLSMKSEVAATVGRDAATGAIDQSPRLVIKHRQAFANDPLPLGISLTGGTGGEIALLNGLLAGTRLSAGSAVGAGGWRVAARDFATVVAFAPQDFVGVMSAAVDVRTPSDSLLDRSVMRLEWVEGARNSQMRRPLSERIDAAPPNPALSPTPTVQPVETDEVAVLLKRGDEYLRNGDLVAARVVLRRAADAGSARAALALGSTFDPVVFADLGVLGFAPDAAQARSWYERAEQLGSSETAHRMERVSRGAQ
jgi:hypothetical protein